MNHHGPTCPECGSEKTMGNRTPMTPGDLAQNPWYCTECRTKFSDDES